MKLHILPSALEHGQKKKDIEHAIDLHVKSIQHTESDRVNTNSFDFLFIGPDRNGELLEIIGFINGHKCVIFQCMPLRKKYAHYLGSEE